MMLPLKHRSAVKGVRKMENAEKLKVEKPELEEKKGRRGSGHTAKEKCRAVLSVWTERRKPGKYAGVGIAWTVLNQWQDRAMRECLWHYSPGCGGQGRGVELASCGIVGAQEQGGTMKELERRLARLQGCRRPSKGDEGGCRKQEGLTLFREVRDGKSAKQRTRTRSRSLHGAGVSDSPGSQRSHDAKQGAQALGCRARPITNGRSVPSKLWPWRWRIMLLEALCFYGRREGDLTTEDT